MSAALAALALGLSLFINTNPIYGNIPSLLPWHPVFLASCLVLLFNGQHKAGKLTPILVIWLIWITISAYIFRVTPTSYFFWTILAACPLYYFSLLTEGIEKHINACGIVLVLLAAGTCYQMFYGIDERVHWPIANPNNLAALMNIGLIYCFYKKNPLTILFFIALYATGSKAGMICGLFGIYILLAQNSLWRIFGLITMLVSSLTALIVNTYYPHLIFKTMLSLYERFDMWSAALVGIKGNLLFGIGLGNYQIVYNSVLGQKLGNDLRFFVHNDPLNFALDMGVPATIIFFIICFYILRSKKILPKAILCSVGLHTFFTFNLYVPAISILLGLTLAIIDSRQRSLCVE